MVRGQAGQADLQRAFPRLLLDLPGEASVEGGVPDLLHQHHAVPEQTIAPRTARPAEEIAGRTALSRLFDRFPAFSVEGGLVEGQAAGDQGIPSAGIRSPACR